MRSFFFCAFFFLFAAYGFALNFSSEFFALESAVYAQELPSEKIQSLYDIAVSKSDEFNAAEKLAYNSLCNELLGRSQIFAGKIESARSTFDDGVSLAEKSLKIEKSAVAQEALVKNISQNMRTRSAAYMIKNGVTLRSKINEILEAEPDSLWGKYLQISQDVYAPKAFTNAKRGKTLAQNLLADEAKMSDALKFNSWTALAKAQILLKEFDNAKLSIEKAEKIFPKNEEIANLLSELPK